jgi:tungstate transport system substrate-binding protein
MNQATFFLSILFFFCLSSHPWAQERLKLATTTSTANSGLLDHLHPFFEKEAGIRVHAIAVGTGKALKLAQNGDVDVVLVHARQAEEAFVKAGHGVNRKEVMYNDFVIVGPVTDQNRVGYLADTHLQGRSVFDEEGSVFSDFLGHRVHLGRLQFR